MDQDNKRLNGGKNNLDIHNATHDIYICVLSRDNKQKPDPQIVTMDFQILVGQKKSA